MLSCFRHFSIFYALDKVLREDKYATSSTIQYLKLNKVFGFYLTSHYYTSYILKKTIILLNEIFTHYSDNFNNLPYEMGEQNGHIYWINIILIEK